MSINARTIISAVSPRRYIDSFTEIMLTVWFEELSGPVEFLATPFDCERHGKELWIRAMAGEYGEVEIIQEISPYTLLLEKAKEEERKLLEFKPRSAAS